MKIGLLLVLLLSIAYGFIQVKDNLLYDQQGRQRIFHGMNVVVKIPPYIPQLNTFNLANSFTEKDMQYLQSWGMNIIRLGVMWPGVQPTEGVYNQTYLQAMDNLIRMAGKYGIYTLLEYHQDLFSEKFCGDGVPLWAINKKISSTFPMPLKTPKKFDQKGMPVGNTCSMKYGWGSIYTTFAVNLGFSALYQNQHGLLDKFVNYWGKMATTFKQNPYIVAYQLINEPWPGDMYNDLFMMIPHVSELVNLQRVYDRLSETIRKNDPNHNICFEPVTWLNTVSAGFAHPPGGDKYANQSILCYHYYNPPTIQTAGFMDARIKDIKRLNVGGMLSEFYIIGDEGRRNVNMMEECDRNQQSWIGWLYKPFCCYDQSQEFKQKHQETVGDDHTWFFDSKGNVDEVSVALVARTYAPIVAGRSINQAFDNNTRQFHLIYEVCTKCGDSVIFANREIIYKQDYAIEVIPKNSVTVVTNSSNYITVSPNANTVENMRIMIQIIPL